MNIVAARGKASFTVSASHRSDWCFFFSLK